MVSKRRMLNRTWHNLLMSQKVMLLLRMVLGAILIVSGLAKLLGQGEFMGFVTSYGLLSQSAAGSIALMLPWLELSLGCLLVAGVLTRWVSAAAIALVGGFIIANAYAMLSGNVAGSEPCGCFVGMAPLNHTGSLILGSLMLLMALPLVFGDCRLLSLNYSIHKYARYGLLSVILVAALVIPPATSSEASTEAVRAAALETSTLLSQVSLDTKVDSTLKSGRPAFLYFYSEACPYCKRQKPIIDELAVEYAGSIDFVRVEAQSGQQAMDKYGVTGVPTMVLILGQNLETQYEYKRLEGLNDEDTLRRYFDSAISNQLSADQVTSSQILVAAKPTPNVKDCDCSQSNLDHGCSIKCKSLKLLDEVCTNSVSLISQANSLVSMQSQDEVINLQNDCDFAMASVNATEPAEFKSYALKRNAKSNAFAEVIGDGIGDDDGICEKVKGDGKPPNSGNGTPLKEYTEWCVEIDDGIGDDDGVCELQEEDENGKKNKYLEPCEQALEADVIDSDDTNFNEEKLGALENYLDGSYQQMHTANVMFATRLAELREPQESPLIASNDNGSDNVTPQQCLDLLQVDDNPWTEHKTFDEAVGFLIAHKETQMLHTMCQPAALTTIFGQNAAFICLATGAATSIASTLWDKYVWVEGRITGRHVKNTANCLEVVAAKIQKMGDDITEIKYAVDNKLELRRVHLQVVELEQKKKYMVSATEAGKLVELDDPIKVAVSVKEPIKFNDITQSTKQEKIETGMYVLTIDLDPSLKNAELFKFEVGHPADPNEKHYGFALFDRSDQNTISTGQ
jgi:thiol-disulfide isomerase/thioredoxin/uncharacterized membrane protein YphA (DoxX/SURF4 family)